MRFPLVTPRSAPLWMLLTLLASAPRAQGQAPLRPAVRLLWARAGTRFRLQPRLGIQRPWASQARSLAQAGHTVAGPGHGDPSGIPAPLVQAETTFTPGWSIPPVKAAKPRWHSAHPVVESLGARADQASDPEFLPVAISHPGVQENLTALLKTFPRGLEIHEIKRCQVRQEGNDLLVRLDLHLQSVEADHGDAADDCDQGRTKACQVRVEVIRGQIRTWHARVVPAQDGEDRSDGIPDLD